MIVFWLAALIPITVGGILWIFGNSVNWREWVISTFIAVGMAALFQLCATLGMTRDVETWSGQVSYVKQYSEWTEYYEKAIYRTELQPRLVSHTDSNGNTSTSIELVAVEVFDHWEPRTEEHPTSWKVFTTLGVWNVAGGVSSYLFKQFGGLSSIAGERTTYKHNSRMIGGDPNDYTSVNKNNWLEPVVTTKSFKNKVKASPSTFSFPKVPTNVCVFPWPHANNSFRSGRVIGEATKTIDMLKWDQMNAQLGPMKKVNVIIIGFGESDPKMADYQRAAWIGGKKNDLVLCYGTIKLEDEGSSVKWTKVFGWTDKNDVKRNLESIVKTNVVDDSIIPLIRNEVAAHYVIKDWKEFDRLTIEPPMWAYWTYFIIMVVVQGGLYWWCAINALNKRYSNGDFAFHSWTDNFLSRD